MHLRAGRRHLVLRNTQIDTPCAIPSYSSRARPPDPLQGFLENTLKDIEGPVLLSAYDLFYRAGLGIAYDVFSEIDEAPTPAVLLDSGGYEEIWNNNAILAGIIPSGGRGLWSEEHYNEILATWETKTELIAVTYDAVAPMSQQIDRARQMAKVFPWLTVDVLLKPIDGRSFLRVSDVSPFSNELADFALIGVTEKELGASMRDRLNCLAELRDCLAQAGLETPIHVFGGLDPLMTPLYFMAGADIFDGLSWLRYAFTGAGSQYEQGYLSLEHPADDLQSASWRQRSANLATLIRLEASMRQVADGASIDLAFGERASRICETWDQVWNET